MAILSKMLQTVSHNLSDHDISKLAWDCQAFVGADLRCLCTVASLKAIEEYSTEPEFEEIDTAPRIRLDHFVEALKSVR